jgi:hypothetical protein
MKRTEARRTLVPRPQLRVGWGLPLGLRVTRIEVKAKDTRPANQRVRSFRKWGEVVWGPPGLSQSRVCASSLLSMARSSRVIDLSHPGGPITFVFQTSQNLTAMAGSTGDETRKVNGV